MIYKAIILNDYEGAHYASKVYRGEKLIETRMNRMFSYRGDIVICCGKTNSVTSNAGKALCLVEIWKGRPMEKGDEEAACIEFHPKRKSLLLRNWRYFSRNFDFAPQYVSGPFQGIFEILLPADVDIIPQPQILPFEEKQEEILPKAFLRNKY